MAVSSHLTRIIVGKVPVSCIATAVNPSTSRNVIDRTALCDTDKVFIPGQFEHSLAVSAMFDDDTAAGSYWAELTDNYDSGTLLPITVGPGGLSAGSPVWLAEAYQMSYAPSSSVGDGVDLGLGFATTGVALFGQSITDLAAVSSTSNSAAVDGGAATSNGGIAHLHVTALSSPTTFDVDIEHSVNGSTSWATLASFTQVTTATATERITVASGTTVRRYLRAAFTVSGTSYTCSVAFARS